MNEYKYAGKHLNYEIAQEIIKDWFKVRGNLTEIAKCVLIHHVTHKGLLPSPNEPCRLQDLDFIVQKALFRLQREKCAKSVSSEDAMWEIIGRLPRFFGEGEESVYLFYDYRDRYIMDDRWACYIGKTGDFQRRIYNHARNLGVEPTVALELKTKDCSLLEKQIQYFLKGFGRLRMDKKGRSWFDTSPDEVVFIYKYIKICDELNEAYDELTSIDGLNRDELKQRNDVFEL